MFSFTFRAATFLAIMFWYTVTVWNLVDDHFTEQFKKYFGKNTVKDQTINSGLKDVCKLGSRQIAKDKYLLAVNDACLVLEDESNNI